jgi:hypothetical protein
LFHLCTGAHDLDLVNCAKNVQNVHQVTDCRLRRLADIDLALALCGRVRLTDGAAASQVWFRLAVARQQPDLPQ